MPFERELSIALEAAREAGAILRRHYELGTQTWEKSEDNPVTLADLEADKAIADRLGAAFPEDAILSEETIREDGRLEKHRVWIVDPMDGTKEFISKN
ncbi:MAG: 3'(2'),5'-bisphosphate nucleotidase CysQ, partial [Myxococcales bacterium]|nr:3'(2'),5'-bisphosphate nucleotidase CysQ [Myxococcales bacterium]